MIFKVNRASDYCIIHSHEMEFESLEELRDYVLKENEEKKACVIWWDTMELLIYDDWIE